MTRSALQRQARVDHGLCPQCGEEAAPYYLCPKCRTLGSIRRMLNRMSERGLLKKSKQGTSSLWQNAESGAKIEDFRWGKFLLEMEDGDKRLRPRLGRRPVDIDEILMSIFADAGRPLQIEEVAQAWGRLRSARKRGSLAADMAAIIKAQRRRDDRARRRCDSRLKREAPRREARLGPEGESGGAEGNRPNSVAEEHP